MIRQRISAETLEYLSGTKFSNSLAIKYRKQQKVYYRHDLMTEYLTGSKTIHVGCCDHYDLIDTKIQNQNWLHNQLTGICSQCLGVDINEKAVNYLRQVHNINNIVCRDILASSNDEISNQQWDYILLAEVLEHVDNPHNFLKGIWTNYRRNIKHLIITVPNAFALINIKYLLNNCEFINSDHRYWFSPYTLSKIAFNSGFTIKEFVFCQPGEFNKSLIRYFHGKAILNNLLLKRYPILGETIFMVLEF